MTGPDPNNIMVPVDTEARELDSNSVHTSTEARELSSILLDSQVHNHIRSLQFIRFVRCLRYNCYYTVGEVVAAIRSERRRHLPGLRLHIRSEGSGE